MEISGNIFAKQIQLERKDKVDKSSTEQTDKFEKSINETGTLIPKSLIDSIQKEEIKWVKEQRPAHHIKTDPDGTVHAGNVRCGFKETGISQEDWEPQFKEVAINPDKVKNVYMMLEPFAPEWAAGHSLAYIEFEDGGVKTADGENSRGLVVSVEARLKEGQTYGLMAGMKHQFKIVYQLGTFEDTVQKTARKRDHKLERYELKLDNEQKKQFLLNSLDESFKNRDNEDYHTLNNSCYSNQMRILNTVLPEEQKIKEWIVPNKLHSPTSSLPTATSAVLGWNGLVDDSGPIIIQPDKTLHPDKQVKPSMMQKMFKKVSELKGWHTMSGIGGLVAGACIGSMILNPIIGIPLMGILGGVVAKEASHYIERESHATVEDAEIYYKKGQYNEVSKPSVNTSEINMYP
jgi:hypothetical protein